MINLFIGMDRSDKCIDVHLLDQQGNDHSHAQILTDPHSLTAWANEILDLLPAGTSAALCIEQPCINLTGFFRRFPSFKLYLINPMILKRYRETFNISKAKDDKKDAHHLAKLLFEKHSVLKPWHAGDRTAAKLAVLTEKRRQLVVQRGSISNKLIQLLKDYYPQAFELYGKTIYAPLACAFLKKWPSLQAIQKATPASIERFYIQHSSRRPYLIERRLKLIDQAIPITDDPSIIEPYSALTVAFAEQLSTISKNIQAFDKMISETVDSHPDAYIFQSLPGAGDQLSARLLAFFGNDCSKYPTVSAVLNHSGISPVTKQSGQHRVVHRRYSCPKFAHQTFVEWAGQTINKSTWAKAYHRQQKAKGQAHNAILRGLAYKWIRIVYRCWQNHQCYDEQHYQMALRKSGSPLSDIIDAIHLEQANAEAQENSGPVSE